MRVKTALFAPAIVLALAASGLCQTLPRGVQKGVSLAGVTEYVYPNGLRVLLYPDDAQPKVTVNVTYLVGSRHEGYGETGMAHLLEHMNFIQTTNGRDVKKELADHGGSYNGSTSYDRTNFYETIPATEENLKWALGLEADRMANIRQAKELLDKEMTVVRNEFERGENSPAGILEERVVATAYLWHNYGKSTIGSKEDIEKVPIDRLAAFYHKYYRPDNAVLVIAGRFDESKALAYVAETLGRVPRPAAPLEATYTVEPPQDGERYVELRRVGTGKNVMMAYHGPAAAHPDAVALQVLSGIMNGAGGGGRGGRGGGGGGATGRLRKALVDTQKAQSASMSFQLLHDPGFVLLSASLSKDQSIDEVRKIILQTIDGIVTEPPTQEEINRVKTQMARSLPLRMADAQQFGLGLSEPIAQGDWRLIFLNNDRVKDVTPDDVVRVAKTYFKASNRTVGVFIPDDQPDRTVVPAPPTLSSMLSAYKPSIVVQRGEAFDPAPANIEKRLERAKLDNGMKLALLQKKTANGRVSAVIQLHFGDQKTLAGQRAAAQFAGSLLMMGTKTKTRQQIQDELQKLNASVSVSGGGGGLAGGGRGGRGGGGGGGNIASATAMVDAPAENFSAAMRLAVEILKEPAFPQEDFDRSKNQRLQTLAEAPTEPAQLAQEELSRHISPFAKTDALYSPTREEQLAEIRKLTLDDVKKFHASFYGASNAEIAILGGIDRAAAQKLAAELLGSWNSPEPYQRLTAAYRRVEAVNRKIETPDKANAQFMAALRFRMTDADPDYPAMVLANYLLGGGGLASRIPDRIRNREGLSYSVSTSMSIPSEGDAATFSMSAIANPGNTPKVESCFKEELARALKDGFTTEEVATAKKAYLDSRMVQRASDSSLLSLIASHEQLGRGFQWDADLEARIASLTAEQINAALRKRIDPAAVSIVKAGDFKAAGVFQ